MSGWYTCNEHGGGIALMTCLHVQVAVKGKVMIGNKVIMIVEKHFGAHLCDQCRAEYRPNMIDGVDENADELNLYPVCLKCYITAQENPIDA